jgi:uncharacterized protein YbjT (DUF2867 family)
MMVLSQPLILATGATGRLAGLVVPELALRGARVRALIRDPHQEAAVRARGASEVSVGNLTDERSLEAALCGVDRLFYIPPAFIPEEDAIGRRVVNTAKRMGVRRIVFSSAIHPTLTQLVNHQAKAAVEEHIIASGLEYAFLQPALVYQNYKTAFGVAGRTGIFAEPYSIESKIIRVDYRDVAEVAAIALCEDRLIYGTFELCAEGHLDRMEVAGLMAQALHRHVEARKIAYAEWLTRSGIPPHSPQAKGLKRMFEWYDTHGLHGNATTLRTILGREPRSLLAFFRELRDGAR